MPRRRRVQSSAWRAPRTRPAQLCSHTTAGNGPAPSGRTTRMSIADCGVDGSRTASPQAQPATRTAARHQRPIRIGAYRLPRMTTKPAVSLVAVAGRRHATLDLARTLENEGFTGIYCPSPGDGMALCEALALATHEIPFGTSVAHIYTRHVVEWAQTAAVIHELAGGRFRFGVGVSHGPAHARLGLTPGKPLEDMRKFVSDLKAYAPQVGALPPI